MGTSFIVAMIAAILIFLLPAALAWYFKIGRIFRATRIARKAGARNEASARHDMTR